MSTLRAASACAELCIGVLGVLVANAAMIYVGFFYAGVLESLSIDQPSVWHSPGLLHTSPLVNNTLLLLLFSVSHSVLARSWLKNLCSALSPSLYRHLNIFQSSLCIFLICYGWSPLPTPALWNIQYTPFRLTLYGVCAFGVVMNIASFVSLPSLNFFGMSEPLHRLTGIRGENGGLVTTGLYGVVRHPMYTSLLISLWFHPTMSLGRLMVSVVLTLYVLVAVPLFEEPDLLELFGEKYRHYMKTTPMLFPIRLYRSDIEKMK